MTKLNLLGMAALLVFSSMSWAQGDKAKPNAGDQELVVVELGEDKDSSDLDFDEATTIRVSGTTPVGIGKLSVKVTGAAKLVRTTNVNRIIGGQKPIGANETE